MRSKQSSQDRQLSALLHGHITIVVELNDAKTRWYASANDIADFLAAANPTYWPQEVMREAMKVHLGPNLGRGLG